MHLMLFGDPPAFASILATLQDLQREINAIQSVVQVASANQA